MGYSILQDMILTYKLKHHQHLLSEREKSRQVALFALKTKTRTTKDVKHIGLKSLIANQILKKYSSNKKLKKISSVKLTLPSQAVQWSHGKIKLSCLKMEIDFDKNIEKIKQFEFDETYAYISCEVKEETKFISFSWRVYLMISIY